MKHKSIIYILILFANISFWSCKKELNVLPTTSEVDGNIIVDAKSASTVLNGVYYTTVWNGTNDITPSEFCGSLVNPLGDDGFYTLRLNSKSGSAVDQEWSYGYSLVNAANGFLKNIAPVTNIPSATKNQMIAEGKFLRAFANSQLLLYYGQFYDTTSKYGIILRDEFVSGDNINLPRSTVGQTYTSILTDLDAAIPDLPARNSQIYYANASAAKILEARVLINRGGPGDYAKVISLTSDVIGNGGFSLEPNDEDLFIVNGFSSPEVIWGVYPPLNANFKFQTYQFFGSYSASGSFMTLLTNDPRNQWVYKSDSGATIYGSYAVVNEVTKYYPGPVVNAVQTPLTENCYVFRLTEAYLLQAEAITLSGGDLNIAKTLLKAVEATAGITDFSDVNAATTASELQLLVVKEEIKSFFCEAGQDWFALRRLPFAEAQTFQPALVSVNQYIMPIPYNETVNNGNIIPNP